MVWYVALVALLNLAFGYGLAHWLGAKRMDVAIVGGASPELGDEAEF